MENNSSKKRLKKKPLEVDKQYVDSEVWKCGDSPTGAHHWVQDLDEESGLTLDEMPFVCKYCRGVKFMESFYTYSKWQGLYQVDPRASAAERAKHGPVLKNDPRTAKFLRNRDHIGTKGRLQDGYLANG